jgi:hypothetical protein
MKINKLGIIAGLAILAISMIINHYFNIPDFISGALQGFAIGIMILAFLKKSRQQKPA